MSCSRSRRCAEPLLSCRRRTARRQSAGKPSCRCARGSRLRKRCVLLPSGGARADPWLMEGARRRCIRCTSCAVAAAAVGVVVAAAVPRTLCILPRCARPLTGARGARRSSRTRMPPSSRRSRRAPSVRLLYETGARSVCRRRGTRTRAHAITG
ncbi:hypothetical protein T492DRAFT_1024026 [Pavlovales sp. CCMP2436]|nr:hypothetical protein T492DRAFT_1024026 [Pavlovales sp. CCMP2436]